MPTPFEKWTVLPHGKLTAIDHDILTVTGDIPMPLGDFPRRMTVVRLDDRRLVIYSAISLADDEMLALEAFGTPAYLIVPNGAHRLDAKVWKDRYPNLLVVAPGGAAQVVNEVVAVDRTSVDMGDSRVQLVAVDGTDNHEVALLVETASGTTLIVNDLIWNVDDRPGFGGWLFKAIGATGSEPKIPKMVQMREIKDKDALRAQLERWSRIRRLERIIVSHGDIIDRDATRVLEGLAESLAA